MDAKLQEIGRYVLNHIREACGARNLTCHFYNPYAKFYWLFHCSGDLKYPYQMNGPLTHPDQKVRFDEDAKPSLHPSPGIKAWIYCPEYPDRLREDVLSGWSFSKREEISSAVLIRLSHDSGNSREHDSTVEIFLNYTEANRFDRNEIQQVLAEQLPLARRILLELLEQPRLNEVIAWRLRSYNHDLRQQLEVVHIEKGKHFESARKMLYKLVTEQTYRLLTDLNNGAKLIFSSLFDVDTENQVLLESTYPSPSELPGVKIDCVGIVKYVARTGQMFLISDVDEYRKRYEENVNERLALTEIEREGHPLPKYEHCSKNTKSELACPLVVQGRVVGVLNVEADRTNAFDEGHVLLLFHIASAAALPLRQVALLYDWDRLITQQHNLLSCANEKQVFEQTLRAVHDLGYQAPAIWDVEANDWIYHPDARQRNETPRSGEGYTDYVARYGKAVGLVDIVLDGDTPEARPAYKFKTAELDPNSGYFTDWKDEKIGSRKLSAGLIDRVKQSGSVLSDFGFPIYEEHEGKRKIRAVLWAKCKRYFRAVLPDEFWCISVLCRNTTEALNALRRMSEASAKGPAQQIQHATLAFHFGDERANTLSKLPDVDRRLKAANSHANVIVLNVDIRGSSAFASALASNKAPEQYVRFIAEYQTEAQKLILEHKGVFDKTMGDGVMALWNVFRREILEIADAGVLVGEDQLEESQKRAILCVRALFDMFNELVSKWKRTLGAIPPSPFCLGAALAQGDAFVGSICCPPATPGFEYSAHGDAANSAGKDVLWARAAELVAELKKPATRRFMTLWSASGTAAAGTPTDEQFADLIRYLENAADGSESILLTSREFMGTLTQFCTVIWRFSIRDARVVLLPVWKADETVGKVQTEGGTTFTPSLRG